MSGKNELEQCQRKQSVACRNKIVGHYAKAIFDVHVKVSRRLRLGDVEIAKKREGCGLPEEGIGRQHQHQPEGNDFIPDDAAVIRITDTLASDIDSPDAEQVGASEQGQQFAVADMWTKENKGDPSEKSTKRAGRPTCQATTATAGDEMRRVGKEELKAGRAFFCLRQSDRIRDDRRLSAGHLGRKL